jgi:DNA-directed RNA polymerase sigma subunit (sigma70/sigma32)
MIIRRRECENGHKFSTVETWVIRQTMKTINDLGRGHTE